MPLQRVSYEFSIVLPLSRDRAYRWATDYRPDDMRTMGLEARRTVRRITPNLLMLTDSFRSDPFDATPGVRTVKEKLVHLYPQRWSWTATHLAGPAQYSQFLYDLTPAGRASCRLRFRGNQVERVTAAPTSASVAQRARTLKAEDSQLWRRLARAMREDPNPPGG